MSILLIGLDEERTPTLIQRLIAQGDEVRVLEDDEVKADRWRALGAHIASGPLWDADLIERAAQNVRTIVVGERHARDPAELMDAVVTGGAFAARDMRVVLVTEDAGAPEKAALRESALPHVVLGVPSRRGLTGKRRMVAPEALAEAIDAADDLAGEPRLELDLSNPRAWADLKLPPPD